MTEAGCVYLDMDDGGFIRSDAEYRGFINLAGKPRRLVYVLDLDSDLRDKKMEAENFCESVRTPELHFLCVYCFLS